MTDSRGGDLVVSPGGTVASGKDDIGNMRVVDVENLLLCGEGSLALWGSGSLSAMPCFPQTEQGYIGYICKHYHGIASTCELSLSTDEMNKQTCL